MAGAMGVTIHYEGRLRSLDAYGELAGRLKKEADKHEWLFSEVVAKKVHLPRVINGKLEDYAGPIKGVVINLHEDCEAFRLLFDGTGFMQGFVKTQFCPTSIHVRIVELLRSVEDLFTDFRVLDEGPYWETGRTDVLDQHKKTLANEIERFTDYIDRQDRESREPGGA